MVQLLLWFVLVIVILYIGYYCGVKNTIENSDIIEGYFLEQRNNDDDEHVMSFTCCPSHQIKEAFQISSGNIPLWAFAPNIDIYISPQKKVVVHKPNGYNVVAIETDYLIKDSNGDFYSCPAEIFESNHSYIEVK